MTRLVLGDYPTPIRRFSDEFPSLFVKRDDVSTGIYGGNKTRKLERLLAHARDSGARTLVTSGAAGSHQIVASTLFGEAHGFSVEGVLASQPSSEYAKNNLRIALAHGLVPIPSPAWALVPARVFERRLRGAHVLPLGGSNALGTLGFVDAARELALQVERGELPEPDEVIVALGSGGTAAGLALGFEVLGMRTRVIGVAICPPVWTLRWLTERLVRRTASLSGLSKAVASRAIARIEVDARWLGSGYGYETSAGIAAMSRAKDAELTLDATYTAKAFACALDRPRSNRTSVYWHTLSTLDHESVRLTPSERAAPLPAHLERLFLSPS